MTKTTHAAVLVSALLMSAGAFAQSTQPAPVNDNAGVSGNPNTGDAMNSPHDKSGKKMMKKDKHAEMRGEKSSGDAGATSGAQLDKAGAGTLDNPTPTEQSRNK